MPVVAEDLRINHTLSIVPRPFFLREVVRYDGRRLLCR